MLVARARCLMPLTKCQLSASFPPRYSVAFPLRSLRKRSRFLNGIPPFASERDWLRLPNVAGEVQHGKSVCDRYARRVLRRLVVERGFSFFFETGG